MTNATLLRSLIKDLLDPPLSPHAAFIFPQPAREGLVRPRHDLALPDMACLSYFRLSGRLPEGS